MAQDALYLWTRGFLNLEAILQLQRCGVHAFVIIKKRYWPRHINRDAFIELVLFQFNCKVWSCI